MLVHVGIVSDSLLSKLGTCAQRCWVEPVDYIPACLWSTKWLKMISLSVLTALRARRDFTQEH